MAFCLTLIPWFESTTLLSMSVKLLMKIFWNKKLSSECCTSFYFCYTLFFPGTEKHQCNMPTGNDVEAVIANLPEDVADHHEVVVHLCTLDNHRNHLPLQGCSPVYNPLHYVPHFPMCDHGGHWDMALKAVIRSSRMGITFKMGNCP